MKTKYFATSLTVFFVIAFVVVSCSIYLDPSFKKTYTSVNEVLYGDTVKQLYLKAHCRNGDVYVFEHPWQLSPDSLYLVGQGKRYSARRDLFNRYMMSVLLDSIVLYETNAPVKTLDATLGVALGILTAANLAGVIYCAINPKACFGSCPTFYLPGDDGIVSARAEGFSSSILPSLERSDLDALNNEELHTQQLTLFMKNEALETHNVNYVHLYAVKREAQEQIFNDLENNFYSCSKLQSPIYATANNMDVTEAVNVFDGKEYFSKTDSFDIAQKEQMILNFSSSTATEQGLVLSFRQTLVTTFLLYSALGYMGNEAGDILADMEMNPVANANVNMLEAASGKIECFAWSDLEERWVPLGKLYETGPIARNTFILPLPKINTVSPDLKIRLVMASGCWRIDYAALASNIEQRNAIELSPQQVWKNGNRDEESLNALDGDDRHFASSIAGDFFELKYTLPDDCDYALFVDSKGYYLEWMRPAWWKEKNLLKLKRMMDGDRKTWRDLAIEYKQHESDMEATFWGSKVF